MNTSNEPEKPPWCFTTTVSYNETEAMTTSLQNVDATSISTTGSVNTSVSTVTASQNSKSVSDVSILDESNESVTSSSDLHFNQSGTSSNITQSATSSKSDDVTSETQTYLDTIVSMDTPTNPDQSTEVMWPASHNVTSTAITAPSPTSSTNPTEGTSETVDRTYEPVNTEEIDNEITSGIALSEHYVTAQDNRPFTVVYEEVSTPEVHYQSYTNEICTSQDRLFRSCEHM